MEDGVNEKELDALALLPCPFCGNKPVTRRFEPHKHFIVNLPDYPGSWSIECVTCEFRIFDHDSAENAAAKWNRRAAWQEAQEPVLVSEGDAESPPIWKTPDGKLHGGRKPAAPTVPNAVAPGMVEVPNFRAILWDLDDEMEEAFKYKCTCASSKGCRHHSMRETAIAKAKERLSVARQSSSAYMLAAAAPSADVVREQLIKHMVNAFLCWRLPNTFSPDCGISFDGSWVALEANRAPWPIGTNLFTAHEAQQMVEHMFAVADAAIDAAKEKDND